MFVRRLDDWKEDKVDDTKGGKKRGGNPIRSSLNPLSTSSRARLNEKGGKNYFQCTVMFTRYSHVWSRVFRRNVGQLFFYDNVRRNQRHPLTANGSPLYNAKNAILVRGSFQAYGFIDLTEKL